MHSPQVLQHVKNIIFDFGNVLLDIDYQLSFEKLSNLLGVEVSLDHIPPTLQKALNGYEMGKINLETFLWNFQQQSKKEMPHGHELIEAWNAMLIGMKPEKFDFLLQLRQQYKVYLLSNTNQTHLEWVYRHLKNVHQVTDFDTTFFDKTYYSHVVGMRKPNRDIYEYVQADIGLDPSETLFFDDIGTNLKAPNSLGWLTYHHDPTDDIIDICTKKLRLLV
jgi:glucose-1-phosphatase